MGGYRRGRPTLVGRPARSGGNRRQDRFRPVVAIFARMAVERLASPGNAPDAVHPAAGSAAAAGRTAAQWRWALLWVAGAAGCRALLATLVPLFPDEAYYWEWTRRLAPGYFDHPPGIALLLAASRALLGDSVLAVRSAPALAALVTHLGAVALAWQLAGRGEGGAVAARRAAVLVAVLPLATLGLVLATPDAPLFAATALAMVGVERALAAPPRSARALGWWGATGVALGGAFVAKYMAVLLPAGLVLACLVHPALRRRFAEPGPWVASAVALALFAPVVWWNATHDWVSFRFQLGHGFSGTPRGTPLGRELELLGGQAGLASPLLFGLLAMAVGSALRTGWRARHTDPPTAPAVRRFALAMVAVVPLAFFAVSAWRRSPEANWPAMLYPAAMALLATTTAPWATGRWWRAGVAVAAGLTAVAMAQAWRPLLPLAAPRDPIARAHGWSTLAEAVQEARRAAVPSGAPWPAVAANRYQEAAVLAFLLPDRPRVLALSLQSRPNQYDLWPGGDQVVRLGGALVAVFQATAREDSLARAVGDAFADARPVATVSLRREAGEVTTRRVWVFTDRRGAWPRSASAAASLASPGVRLGVAAGAVP